MTVRVFVEHAFHGCDSGCCGHVVTLERDGVEEATKFVFDHPGGGKGGAKPDETPLEFARDLVTEEFGPEHVADLDWDRCVIVDD